MVTYECPYCGDKFATGFMHQTTEDLLGKEGKMKCSHCFKKFILEIASDTLRKEIDLSDYEGSRR
jgi:hypothetical protein